jgi:hypothetical protein
MSERDMKLIRSINIELLNDVLQTVVILYKMAPDQTPTNLYGETSPDTGKIFFPGIEVPAIIERAEIGTDQDEFGPSRSQAVVFKFMEQMLKEINFFPETGDVLEFNGRYHEIDNVVQEQLLGNIPEKSFSIICHTHYSRLSKLNLIKR